MYCGYSYSMYSPNFTYAQPSVPNGILTVAYKQLSDGKLSNAVYQVQPSVGVIHAV